MKLPVMYETLSIKDKRKVREQYREEQGDDCFWCKHPLSIPPPQWIRAMSIDWSFFPQGFLNYPVHLQHNHQTGLTEGAVHARCNAVMWQYYGR